MEKRLFHQMAELEETHWWFRGRRAILDHLLSELSLPPNADILEAGCGTGGNLAMLSRYGNVHAMELDETSLAYAAGRCVGTVCRGSLPEEIPFGDKRFDLIALLDVLEHVERDRDAVGALASRLNEGGWLLVTVPAFQFLYGAHDLNHHHFRRYRRKEVEALLSGNGMRIHLLSYFNTFLFPAIAAARLAQKLVPFAGDDLGRSRPGRVNEALARVFGSERHLLSRTSLPFGVSLVAVCRREAGGDQRGTATPR